LGLMAYYTQNFRIFSYWFFALAVIAYFTFLILGILFTAQGYSLFNYNYTPILLLWFLTASPMITLTIVGFCNDRKVLGS
jgi:uncharacterized protein with PQ loop repeat